MDRRQNEPPRSMAELDGRAQSLAGKRLHHLVRELGWTIPSDLGRHKGWMGQLVEAALGAQAGNRAAPDFPSLGVELKTIPVDASGRPLETTFVCTVSQRDPDAIEWATSPAKKKLDHILWVPILVSVEAAEDRMIGSPLRWRPTSAEEAMLRRDWQEHMDVIRRGLADAITAHDGQVLQIRPKGASAESQTWGRDSEDNLVLTRPRAFYLRRSFTEAMLARHFALG